ncbi:MAG: hypothetical protein AAGK23_08060 [Pseudomonadota bacterium]
MARHDVIEIQPADPVIVNPELKKPVLLDEYLRLQDSLKGALEKNSALAREAANAQKAIPTYQSYLTGLAMFAVVMAAWAVYNFIGASQHSAAAAEVVSWRIEFERISARNETLRSDYAALEEKLNSDYAQLEEKYAYTKGRSDQLDDLQIKYNTWDAEYNEKLNRLAEVNAEQSKRLGIRAEPRYPPAPVLFPE